MPEEIIFSLTTLKGLNIETTVAVLLAQLVDLVS
jgi:hypothetical protein